MSNGTHCIRLLTALTALALAALAGGCISANVDSKGWQGVARDYKDTYSDSGDHRRAMTEKRAVKIARDRAEKEGIDDDDFDKYRIEVQKKDEFWLVTFDLKRSRRMGWPDHFTVRVDKEGNTLIYKGR
ncbi:MAG TPA: hypothetical protein VNA25_02605 [Phycisphaerae bacterium]|nr:hypothetical protein [Phycisphaerae bacterium]